MFIIYRLLVLVGLIKLLLVTRKPFLCSGIYAVLTLGASIVSDLSFELVIVITAVRFTFATLYMWLLDRYENSGIVWWLILVGGIAIGMV
jgi:hypothetical protein